MTELQIDSTIGPHPQLAGVVALDLADDVTHPDLTEALDLACKNGYWVAGRESGEYGTTLLLTRMDQ